jgi:hypothetical protein
VTVIAPARGPETAGVKVTLIVQLAPGARPLPQVLSSENSLVADAMLVMLIAAAPVFVSVTNRGALVVLTI